jgi:hypothetical protein
MNVHGFEEDNITVLMDDGEHLSPTKDNIIDAYKKIVADSEADDAIFLHYSGKLVSIYIYTYHKPSWNICLRVLRV